MKALLIFGLIFFQLKTYASDWSENYKEISPSIPIIIQGGAICSGYLHSPRISVTAAHCVDGIRSTYIQYGETEYLAEIIAIDSLNDIALLRHPAVGFKNLKLREQTQEIKTGEEVASIGHPTTAMSFSNPVYDTSFTYLLSTGIISTNNKDFLVSDMSLSPGNSGGPVFDKNARVVGIVSRKRIDAGVGDIGIATTYQKVRSLIDRSDENKPALRWKDAKHKFYSKLALESLSFTENNVIYSYSVVQWQLGLSLWRRLDFEFGLPLNRVHNENGSLLSAKIKYSLEYEMDNHSFISIKPILGSASFSESSFLVKGISIQHSTIPMAIALYEYTNGEKGIDKMNSVSFEFGTSF